VDLWRSPAGAPLLPVWPRLEPDQVDATTRSVWRYRAWLPVPGAAPAITLGEGGTPLVESHLCGCRVHLKMEYLQPTGSYKDRGSAVLAAALTVAGTRRAVEDSSGNAGASLAAYLAAAGIRLRLFVPAGTPPARVAQAEAAGALVDRQAASRSEAAALAQQAAMGRGVVYASHVFSPYFLAGQSTMAFEMAEDLAGRVPDSVVVPLGSGVLLLGLYHGFLEMRRSGLTSGMPRLFAVQAAACAPIHRAWARGATQVTAVRPRPTGAVGIAVAAPPRGAAVLSAVRASGGAVLRVTEAQMRRAREQLARRGWFVELSSAAPVAALGQIRARLADDEIVIIPLTGSGLKG
jgi:threonine synthase